MLRAIFAQILPSLVIIPQPPRNILIDAKQYTRLRQPECIMRLQQLSSGITPTTPFTLSKHPKLN